MRSDLKRRPLRSGAAGLVVVMVTVGLGACSTSPQEAAEDTQNANAQLCSSLSALRGQVTKVTAGAVSAGASGETVTVGEAQAALGEIKAEWAEVKADAQDVSESVRQQFELAQEQYQEALSNVDSDDSLSSAKGQVESAQRQLRSSYDAMITQLGC